MTRESNKVISTSVRRNSNALAASNLESARRWSSLITPLWCRRSKYCSKEGTHEVRKVRTAQGRWCSVLDLAAGYSFRYAKNANRVRDAYTVRGWRSSRRWTRIRISRKACDGESPCERRWDRNIVIFVVIFVILSILSFRVVLKRYD